MSILSLIGITDAFAAAAHPAPSASESIMSVLPFLVLLFAFLYFFSIRPQQKRAKEHRDLVTNLTKGDEVLTTGGVLGKIEKISDDFIVLSVADNVTITLQKPAIAASMPKGTMKSVN